MSPEAVTQGRIYFAVKRDYWEGRFRAGERVDIRSIADRHTTSPTPVREVLGRMVGERLFEHGQGGGLRPAILDPRRLAELYALNRDLIFNALAQAESQYLRRVLLVHRSRRIDSDGISLAHHATSLFNAIVEGAGNRELLDLMQNIAERLLLVRIAEPMVFPDVAQELRSMTRNGLVDIRRVFSRRIARYHERRIHGALSISIAAFE
jgi:DNA-binding GntR family transcriptional regulator